MKSGFQRSYRSTILRVSAHHPQRTSRTRPIADISGARHHKLVKRLPPTNAQLRVHYAPVRTWVALCTLGLFLTVVRHLVYDIPLVPVRQGLVPLWLCLIVGTLYTGTVHAWLAMRRLNVR